MKVGKRKLNKWRSLQEWGDIGRIAGELRISRPLVKQALEGEGTVDVIEKIDQYFASREGKIKEINKSK